VAGNKKQHQEICPEMPKMPEKSSSTYEESRKTSSIGNI